MLIRRRTVETLATDLHRLAATLDESADVHALRGDMSLADIRRSAATAYEHASALVESRLLPRRP